MKLFLTVTVYQSGFIAGSIFSLYDLQYAIETLLYYVSRFILYKIDILFCHYWHHWLCVQSCYTNSEICIIPPLCSYDLNALCNKMDQILSRADQRCQACQKFGWIQLFLWTHWHCTRHTICQRTLTCPRPFTSFPIIDSMCCESTGRQLMDQILCYDDHIMFVSLMELCPDLLQLKNKKKQKCYDMYNHKFMVIHTI